MLVLALRGALALDPFGLDGALVDVDLEAARDGVVVRLREAADDWQVRVENPDGGDVRVRLTSPGGVVLVRDVTLEGEDPEARGRELAAALAVIIETHDAPAPAPEPVGTPPPPPPPEPPVVHPGWLAIGGRVGGGPPLSLHIDGGLTLAGGAWLARDRVQPVLEAGWSRSVSDGLAVDAVRISAGALFGGAVLRRRLWLGAGAVAGALGASARAETRASAWSGIIAIPLAVQGRLGRLLVEGHAGPQFSLPPLRFLGAERSLRWGLVRFFAGLRVGITFG